MKKLIILLMLIGGIVWGQSRNTLDSGNSTSDTLSGGPIASISLEGTADSIWVIDVNTQVVAGDVVVIVGTGNGAYDTEHTVIEADADSFMVAATFTATGTGYYGQVYIGTSRDLLVINRPFASILVKVYNAHAGTISTTLQVQFSQDNSNWKTYSRTIADETDTTFAFRVEGRYYRVRYINATIRQTAFRLSSILHLEDMTAGMNLEEIGAAIYVDDEDWSDGVSKHILTGGIYQSSPQTITNGDTGPIQVDANGNIIETNSGAIKAAVEIMDDWDDGNYANVNVNLAGTDAATNAGVLGTDVQRVTIATDDEINNDINAIRSIVDSTKYDEDATHVSGDDGLFVLAVRNDAGTALAGDGDYIPLQVNDVGALNINTQELGGIAIDLNTGVLGSGTQRVTIATDDEINDDLDNIRLAVEIMDDWDDGDLANVNINIAGTDVAANSGTNSTQTLRVTIATDDEINDDLDAIRIIVDSTKYDEDAAHVTGDDGLFVLAVRNDAGTSLAGTTLDYAPLSLNDVGALNTNTQELGGAAIALNAGVLAAGVQRVTIATDDEINDDIDAIKTAVEIMDDWDDGDYANVNMNIAGTDIAANAGTNSAQTQRVTIATNDEMNDDLDALASAGSVVTTLYIATLSVTNTQTQLASHPNVQGLTITNVEAGSVVDIGISGTHVENLLYLDSYTFLYTLSNSNLVYVISDQGGGADVDIIGGY